MITFCGIKNPGALTGLYNYNNQKVISRKFTLQLTDDYAGEHRTYFGDVFKRYPAKSKGSGILTIELKDAPIIGDDFSNGMVDRRFFINSKEVKFKQADAPLLKKLLAVMKDVAHWPIDLEAQTVKKPTALDIHVANLLGGRKPAFLKNSIEMSKITNQLSICTQAVDMIRDIATMFLHSPALKIK